MEEKVKEIIAKYQGIEVEKIGNSSRLIQDIGLSSFDVMGLVCSFEENFEIEIPDRDIAKVRTVQDIIDTIEKIKKQ